MEKVMTAEKVGPLGHQHNEIIQCHRGDFAAIFRWNEKRKMYEIVSSYRFSDILPNESGTHTNSRLPAHTQILDKRLAEMLK